MKYFNFFWINLIAFAILFFLFSLLFPAQILTSKTVNINATKIAVANKISDTLTWKNWNELTKNTFTKCFLPSSADTLNFLLKNKNNNVGSMQFTLFSQQNNTTILTCTFIQKLPWYSPWKKFSAMVINKNIAALMDTSLNNLKTQIEQANN